MSFVLASSSQSRLELFKRMGFFPEIVVSPDIDEMPLKGEDVRCYARRMSETKASVVSSIYSGKIVFSADTVAAKGSVVLPKAILDEDVRKILFILSGRRHNVYTSVSLLVPSEKVRTKIVVTTVKFKRLTLTEIDGYVASSEGIGKAGGYSIQGRANMFIRHIGGSFTNVIGLPMYEVASMLNSVKIYPNWVNKIS